LVGAARSGCCRFRGPFDEVVLLFVGGVVRGSASYTGGARPRVVGRRAPPGRA